MSSKTIIAQEVGMTEPRYFLAQWPDDDEGWSLAVGTTALQALGETCAALDERAETHGDLYDDADEEHPGAPYRVQISEVVPVKLSSIVDVSDDDDGNPPRLWRVLDSTAFGGGATEYFPAIYLTDNQSEELETILQLCSLDDRRAALDAFAEKSWPFGWWRAVRADGSERTCTLELGTDFNAWADALPEWSKP